MLPQVRKSGTQSDARSALEQGAAWAGSELVGGIR